MESTKKQENLSRRIIPCLDVRDGRLTKGIKFQGNVDIGDPVETAKKYYLEGADEIVFYDITASHEKRSLFLDIVSQVAENIFIPFSVGGGISTLESMRDVLLAGAEKISLNSAAVKNPKLIAEGAYAFGSQAVVVGMDVLKVEKSLTTPSGYEIVTLGGRNRTGKDALAWALECQRLGAGEICLNSIDADGMKTGYELELTNLICSHLSIPVIASGGAGKPIHLKEALEAGASAALVASIVHNGEYSINELKDYLTKSGIKVRRV